MTMDAVKEYYRQVWTLGDDSGMHLLCAPDYRRHLSPEQPPLDLGQQRDRLAGLRSAFPQMRVSVEQMVNDGQCAAVKMRYAGVHRGQFMAFAPTRKKSGRLCRGVYAAGGRQNRRALGRTGVGRYDPTDQ